MSAEIKNFLKRTLPVVVAMGLMYLASSGSGEIKPNLPITGKSGSELPISTLQDGSIVGHTVLAGHSFPIMKYGGDVCPLVIPDGVIIYCDKIRNLRDGTIAYYPGGIFSGHNLYYTRADLLDPSFRGSQHDPGGSAIASQDSCVDFAGRLLTIGKFAISNRNDAWILPHSGDIFITSRDVTTTEPNPVDTVWRAPLTPCEKVTITAKPAMAPLTAQKTPRRYRYDDWAIDK